MKKSLFLLFLLFATTLSAQQLTTPADTVITESETLEEPIHEPSASPTCPFLDTEKGKYYLDGKPISNKEVEEFLRLNDPEAWQSYRVGNPMWISGWCTLGVGVACAVTGIGMVVVPAVHVFGSALLWAVTLGAYQADDLNYDTSLVMTVGAGLLYAGEALTFASIPLIAVGGVKKFRAHGIYNENCLKKQSQPQLELSLQASSNGLGFALRF